MEFEGWPKTARLNTDAVYTEKIDGTNAAISIEEVTQVPDSVPENLITWVRDEGTTYAVYAQSRNRFITPGQDNHGFAKYVAEHAEVLAPFLGPGRHFGEWWGSGILRGYDLPKGEKRFSLFNTRRWSPEANRSADFKISDIPSLYMVPLLEEIVFHNDIAEYWMHELRQSGSWASPGFSRPEGVCVYHQASDTVYKTFLENDKISKRG